MIQAEPAYVNTIVDVVVYHQMGDVWYQSITYLFAILLKPFYDGIEVLYRFGTLEEFDIWSTVPFLELSVRHFVSYNTRDSERLALFLCYTQRVALVPITLKPSSIDGSTESQDNFPACSNRIIAFQLFKLKYFLNQSVVI